MAYREDDDKELEGVDLMDEADDEETKEDGDGDGVKEDEKAWE